MPVAADTIAWFDGRKCLFHPAERLYIGPRNVAAPLNLTINRPGPSPR